MDKQAAERLITNTFNYPFDIGKYKLLSRNIFKEFEEAEFIREGTTYIPEGFISHIKKYERLGKYEDAQGRVVDILIVYINEGVGLDKARTLQRNFIANYLDDRGKDAALVAFTTSDMEDWRFSLITIEYKTVQDESGKVKTKKVLSNAKRFSFLVGKNEANHTAQQQVIPLLTNNNNPSIEDLEYAFSVEQVTNEFYQEYKKRFLELGYEINRVLDKDEKIKREFSQQNINTDNFAKKLMGQIVFLYFVQKKGWLGVGKDDDGNFLKWGEGDKKFMRSLFEKKFCEYDNYFNDVLEPLFYEALATERANNYYSNFECKIPFLSGGLFEPMNGYNWQETDITISNNVIELILDTFDRYNFTVKEDDPLDKEVAIDPEMLGKVFENLLPENLKKGNGAFYTPRPIVHYMCQESLINYLDTHLDIDKKDITLFVKEGEAVVEHDKIASTKEKGYDGKYQQRMPSSIIENAAEIDELLTYVKICDPAIGSGAFPMGLLHEIVVARNILTTYIGDEDWRTKYKLKSDCIQNSIYGVDIDEGAIEIAKLRLWLSLIVDEDDIENIKPLPNLDYKIICGNSLISRYELDSPIDVVFSEFNKKVKSKDYQNTAIRNLVGNQEVDLKFYKKLTNDFLSESSHSKKIIFRKLIDEIKSAFKTELEDKDRQKLSVTRGAFENLSRIDIFGEQEGSKTEISRAKKKLEKLEKAKKETKDGAIYKNAVEWRFEFPDLLNDNGVFTGFDIVIANPPYIDSETMILNGDEILRMLLTKRFTHCKGNWDIYIAFFSLSFEVLNSNGNYVFITPDKWISRPFGFELRKGLIRNISSIIETGRDIFKNAKVDSIITFIKRKETEYLSIQDFKVDDGLEIININKNSLTGNYSLDWLFSEHISLIKKIDNHPDKFKSHLNCESACATSDAYKLKEFVFNGNCDFTENNFKIANTGTIDKYIPKWGKKEMKYLGEKYLFPMVIKEDFLSGFTNSYAKKSNLPKIIIKGLTLLDGFIDTDASFIAGKSTLVITSEDVNQLYFPLALVNSKLWLFYIKEKYRGSSYNTGINFNKNMINEMPMPFFNSEIVNTLNKLIKSIISLKMEEENSDELEGEINNIVYKVYELTYAEVLIVDEAFAMSEVEYNNFEL